MLRIRGEQRRAFEAASANLFVERIYEHLQRYFPRHCALLGAEQMQRVIRHGWTKSVHYGLTTEPCVRSYIDLTCVLGGGFDEDPLLPWAAEILRDRQDLEPLVRSDRLYERAWAYIDAIASDVRDDQGRPTTDRFVVELNHFRNAPDRPVTPALRPTFTAFLAAELTRLFPAKCAYVGEAAVIAAVAEAMDCSQHYGFAGERAIGLFVTMRFLLGRGFTNDPLLPWVEQILRDPTIPDPRTRSERLHARGVSILRQWWTP